MIQIVMVGLVIAFPNLVSGGLGKKADVDLNKVNIEAAPESGYKKDFDQNDLFGPAGGASAAGKK